jgi:hypothetical protein
LSCEFPPGAPRSSLGDPEEQWQAPFRDWSPDSQLMTRLVENLTFGVDVPAPPWWPGNPAPRTAAGRPPGWPLIDDLSDDFPERYLALVDRGLGKLEDGLPL